MEKKDLIKILNEIFLPIGFKNKGSNWVQNGEVINKIINLQKSEYSNAFYINYGYNIKSIPTDGLMHIYNRLASINPVENKEIKELLDFENSISNDQRIVGLKSFIINILKYNIQMINSEEDILAYLKKRPHLNDISLMVKKHYNLI